MKTNTDQDRAEQETLASVLAAARKDLGLTQEQMAERLDVSQVTISQWESGKVKPAPAKLSAVSAAYVVDHERLSRLWMAASAAATAARLGAA